MQQAVNAAEINERTVIGDVLDHALENLAFREVGNQFGTGFGAGFFQHGAARDNDIATAAVHLEDLERLRVAHQRGYIANRADIHLAARQEGHGTVQVDSETTLYAAIDLTGNALGVFERLFQFFPGFLAAGLFAGQHDIAVLVFVAFDKDVDNVADLDRNAATGGAEFLEGNTAFRFQAYIDNRIFVVGSNNGALEHRTFKTVFADGFVEHRGKVFVHCGHRVRCCIRHR